jgi:hypothetical protein
VTLHVEHAKPIVKGHLTAMCSVTMTGESVRRNAVLVIATRRSRNAKQTVGRMQLARRIVGAT